MGRAQPVWKIAAGQSSNKNVFGRPRYDNVPGDRPEPDPLGPLFRQCMLWKPERVAASAWVEHVPFAFWLVDVLRPQRIVELGTFSGVSYSAMCQAVQLLGLNTSCYAVDTWRGDEHAGFYSEDVYRDFRSFHDRRYNAFSRLVRSTFDDALSHFDDGTIDLLHIDGLHTYETVRHDFEAWLPKLSANAIVLFHDTNVREASFGVHRLWREISKDRRHFEFIHGHGLGVLATGSNYSEALSFLLEAEMNDKYAASIRSIFSELGCTMRTASDLTERESRIRALELQINALKAALGIMNGSHGRIFAPLRTAAKLLFKFHPNLGA